MYWDLLKVDLFLRQICSNKRLVSFATITVLLTHPGMYFALVCLVHVNDVILLTPRFSSLKCMLGAIQKFGKELNVSINLSNYQHLNHCETKW